MTILQNNRELMLLAFVVLISQTGMSARDYLLLAVAVLLARLIA